MTDPSPPIPRAAAWLGAAGLVPFIALAALGFIGDPVMEEAALRALQGYGAVILSFMGGAQWGLTMRATQPGYEDTDRSALLGYGASVVPALVAWACLLLDEPKIGLIVLAVAFVALLAYDRWTVRKALAPAWYGRLRWRLTGVVVMCLAAAVLG